MKWLLVDTFPVPQNHNNNGAEDTQCAACSSTQRYTPYTHTQTDSGTHILICDAKILINANDLVRFAAGQAARGRVVCLLPYVMPTRTLLTYLSTASPPIHLPIQS